MFTKPTVFVIGAGASYVMRLPTWRRTSDCALRRPWMPECRTRLSLLPFIFDRYGTENKSAVKTAARTPSSSSESPVLPPTTLSNWLSDDPAAIELGKIAIASEILIAETKGDLSSADQPNVLAKFDLQHGSTHFFTRQAGI